MPNSADKPIEVDAALDEDSDVIELTEEVPEENGGGFDLFDDFAMPEFRPGKAVSLPSIRPRPTACPLMMRALKRGIMSLAQPSSVAGAALARKLP